MHSPRYFPVFIALISCIVLLSACTKTDSSTEDPGSPAAFATFTIQAGKHASDQSSLRSVTTSNMRFVVLFDSSAIYYTKDTINQSDINKLWGFSEGIDNQYNSARIGWAWYNQALRLYGYTYKNGVRSWAEITSVDIGKEVECSIAVSPSQYTFHVNKHSISMERGPTTTQASGLQQFPYFGGDETAPHLITLQLKAL